MFDKKSRYAKLPPVLMYDGRGRIVEATPPARKARQDLLGIHALRQGERPDLLATHYLSHPAGYWRIAEINDAMTAEVLTLKKEVSIPTKTLEFEDE
jgi:hypothetical protein